MEGLLISVMVRLSLTTVDHVERRMLTFKSLARVFTGAPLVQKVLKNHVAAL
ncbi:hypothetical protein C1H46_043703 [Malus baccata]|nr:hypothetical protein C1H46_043703 [Malus baccata]